MNLKFQGSELNLLWREISVGTPSEPSVKL
jgi:hypothetical protein